jgi:hypothetical protein
MVLATWLLPLLWSWARFGHQASQFWSRLQHFPYAQLFHSSPYILSFNPRHCAACPRTTPGMVWGLVIVGCILGSLTLAPRDPAGSGTIEATDLPRAMAVHSRASLITNHTEVRPLLHTVALTSLTDEGVTQDVYDVDDDDSQAIPHLSLGPNFLLPVLIMGGLIESTYFCFWPIHFLLRPQLLSSL